MFVFGGADAGGVYEVWSASSGRKVIDAVGMGKCKERDVVEMHEGVVGAWVGFCMELDCWIGCGVQRVWVAM